VELLPPPPPPPLRGGEELGVESGERERWWDWEKGEE
jgi:hypothetical protein